MNRQIMFRAWDSKDKLMRERIKGRYWMGLEYETGKLVFISEGKIEDAPVDRFVLEQYTGLKDKNGKMIWEGDVVNIGTRGGSSPVVYMDGGPRVEQKNYREAMRIHKHGAWVELWVEASTCEVIGNIHENSDLL